MRSRLWALGAVPILCCVACKPKFEPSGSLTIDSMSFQPSVCHVLSTGGIELFNASGSRLLLTMPPRRLDAFRSIGGTPCATWEVRGKPAVELGPCGSLTLTGEGYHGSGRRAASGRMALSCSGDVTIKGGMTFKGCF